MYMSNLLSDLGLNSPVPTEETALYSAWFWTKALSLTGVLGRELTALSPDEKVFISSLNFWISVNDCPAGWFTEGFPCENPAVPLFCPVINGLYRCALIPCIKKGRPTDYISASR